MTTHKILIGARDRETVADIGEIASAKDARFVRKIAPDSLVLTGTTSNFNFLQISESGRVNDIRFYDGEPTLAVIEDIDGVTNEIVDELVATLLLWSGNNAEQRVTFYWDLTGLAPARILELTEKLLPLVMLG